MLREDVLIATIATIAYVVVREELRRVVRLAVFDLSLFSFSGVEGFFNLTHFFSPFSIAALNSCTLIVKASLKMLYPHSSSHSQNFLTGMASMVGASSM